MTFDEPKFKAEEIVELVMKVFPVGTPIGSESLHLTTLLNRILSLKSAPLFAKLDEAHAALRLALTRATADPDHDYRKCSEPSCILGRKVLGEK